MTLAVETEGTATNEEDQTEELETEKPEGEEEEGAQAEADSEVVVTIGDESPPSEEVEEEAAAPWVKELRKKQRETARENRELKAQLAQKQTTAVQTVTVGPKPTLEAADYDTEKFEADLTAWHERKRLADAEERKKQDAVEADQKAWQGKLETYGKQKSALKVADYEDAEAEALGVLSITQQGIILSGSDNPAVVVYALGKNPAKAKELSSITDPVKFAFAVAKLETQMKVTPRKTAPLPETKVSGSGRTAVASDSKMNALEAEADKTGDRSKLVAYRKAMKAKSAS